MTISSQVLNNFNNYEILNEYYLTSNTGKSIKHLKIRCKTCGEERDIYSSHLKRTICKTCKSNSINNEPVGKTIGIYTILNYEYTAKGYHRYYKVRCNHCQIESIKGYDGLGNEKTRCINCLYDDRRSENTPRNAMYYEYQNNAKRRNLEFDLTKEDFIKIIKNNCYYCGCLPSEYKASSNRTNIPFLANGIDRIDNNKGYIQNNCIPCCQVCNRMKMADSYSDFLNKISQIYINLINKGSTTIPEGSTLQANGSGNGNHPSIDVDEDIV